MNEEESLSVGAARSDEVQGSRNTSLEPTLLSAPLTSPSYRKPQNPARMPGLAASSK